MSQLQNTLAAERASTNQTAPENNIIDTAIGAGIFTTLAAGIKAAGLTGTLAGKGPFTVFAPTDEAFKRLPTGAMDALLEDSAKLKAVLSYHVIAGHVSAKDMKSGEVMTLQGSPLTAVVSSSEVKINGAHVRRLDLVASNGVIHAIDAVIMPKNLQLLVAAALRSPLAEQFDAREGYARGTFSFCGFWCNAGQLGGNEAFPSFADASTRVP
jgi:uncharacterized surface protein with fasciclin (FAS1) repeats